MSAIAFPRPDGQRSYDLFACKRETYTQGAGSRSWHHRSGVSAQRAQRAPVFGSAAVGLRFVEDGGVFNGLLPSGCVCMLAKRLLRCLLAYAAICRCLFSAILS